ncbi:MAG: 30S ribosomal protein S6 [Parcubacteria group bacterium]|jgi:small subunit ribosomal protein S6|nr:30S ribosomal protein S6 [Parcubacteria group bacterium]|tara:strand:+ start:4170 stop:4673 length:504 start_codon:yes stop_codon:yes gene_type:complete
MINYYEIFYLVPASYTEEELIPIKDKVKELITKADGEIKAEDNFGKKKLAYPVNKNHQGYYLLYEFNIDGEKIKDLDQNLKLTNEVLRHVIVKTKPHVKKEIRIQPLEMESSKPKAKPTEPERPKPRDSEPPKPSEPTKGGSGKDDSKLKLEDLDQRLDEILEGDIL